MQRMCKLAARTRLQPAQARQQAVQSQQLQHQWPHCSQSSGLSGELHIVSMMSCWRYLDTCWTGTHL